ncbi:MAG: glutamyl-tRNA amidotransferase [Bacteroidetes bacterium 47-18]|nr:MAG: glutamyl-tRNA amidotransferase [Bacteroidetes bacterium 47-18]
MSLEAKVMEQLKQAMRDKNEAALRTLRAIKSAILVEKTSVGAKETLTEEEEVKIIQKMIKQRKDSIAIFTEQNRHDLAEKEQEEVAVLENFLPQQLSAEELQAAVREIIAQTGAASAADLGKVMGQASKQLAGRADGKAIADMVKSLLS